VTKPNRKLPKLIRDYIPSIIRKDGYEPKTMIATGVVLERYVFNKLFEEFDELRNALDRTHRVEEFADVYEVLGRLQEILGITWAEIEPVMSHKRFERGGFVNGVILKSYAKIVKEE
jgi:predicted house-cleaning noncanonical NTP pyrophosphatase (MazG superfamily)